MKKRLLAALLAVTIVMALMAGCGAAAPADTGTETPDATETPAPDDSGAKTYKMGLSMPARDQFLTSLETAAKDKAAEMGIDFSVVDANGDASAQIAHVQTFAANGCDAIIVGMVNNDSAQEIINAAGDAKVVFVNRQPDLSVLKDGEVVYVGTDERLYGQNQAKYLSEVLKAEGKTDIKAILFMGILGLDNVNKRTDSVKQGLKDAGINVEYVYEDTAEWDRAKAMDKMVQVIGGNTEYDVVICNNDDMALGVIEAYKSLGKEIDVPIVGIDATEVGVSAIKDGTLACTVFQDPVAQGGGTITCAIGMLEGTEVEGLVDNYYNITPVLVTKDNVDTFKD